MKKTVIIHYDLEEGHHNVQVNNASDHEVLNAVANICSGVAKSLVKAGMSVEVVERKMVYACSAGIAACRKEMGYDDGEDRTLN